MLSSHQNAASFWFLDNNPAGPWLFISVCWIQSSDRGRAGGLQLCEIRLDRLYVNIHHCKWCIKHMGELISVLIFLRALQREKHVLIVSCRWQTVPYCRCPGPEKSLGLALLISTGSNLALGSFSVDEAGGTDCQDLSSQRTLRWTN